MGKESATCSEGWNEWRMKSCREWTLQKAERDRKGEDVANGGVKLQLAEVAKCDMRRLGG